MNQKRLLATFKELLGINCPSCNEGLMADYITSQLKARGAIVVQDSAHRAFGGKCGNLYATLPGQRAGVPIIFSAHMDTVLPTENIRVIEENGIIKTDGTTILGADDKAGIAVMLELAETLGDKSDVGPVEFVFSAAEEKGLVGISHFDFRHVAGKHAFILDSGIPVGNIITQTPYARKVHVTVRGKTAHAGINPETGISAIQIAADAIAQMRLGRVDEETTANIGIISGGTATNIVTGHVEFKGEVRSFDETRLERQINHMHACVKQSLEKYGGSGTFDQQKSFNGYKIDDDAHVVKMVEKAATACGLQTQACSSGGGTDANVFNENGIQAVSLGMGYNGGHSEHEQISIASLCKMAELVEMIALQNTRPDQTSS